MTTTRTGRTARRLVAALLIAWLATGCATPYAVSYEPILDPADERLVKADSIEHRWVKNMQASSAHMYRQGYVMVGYSYLNGSHLPAVAPTASKRWGRKLDAAYVLQVRNRSLYLATYWRRADRFELGAYYVDAPAAAHRSIGLESGVIVQEVVKGSPAALALLMPGDLLLALDDEMIPNARWLDDAIAGRAGKDVTLTVWPMQGAEPVNMSVTLAGATVDRWLRYRSGRVQLKTGRKRPQAEPFKPKETPHEAGFPSSRFFSDPYLLRIHDQVVGAEMAVERRPATFRNQTQPIISCIVVPGIVVVVTQHSGKLI